MFRFGEKICSDERGMRLTFNRWFRTRWYVSYLLFSSLNDISNSSFGNDSLFIIKDFILSRFLSNSFSNQVIFLYLSYIPQYTGRLYIKSGKSHPIASLITNGLVSLSLAVPLDALRLYIDDNNSLISSAHDIKNNYYDVETITLKDIFERNKIQKVDFVKIDIEGMEFDLIENLEDSIFQKIDKFLI